MKFTITRINRQNQLMVSLKSIDRFGNASPRTMPNRVSPISE